MSWLAIPFILLSFSSIFAASLTEEGQGPRLVVDAGHAKPVSAVAFSPDGKILASGSGDLTVKVWDVATDLEIRTLTGIPKETVFYTADTKWMRFLAFGPSGKTLFAGAKNHVNLWEISTGQTLLDLKSSTVRSIGFSTGGKAYVVREDYEDARPSLGKFISLWEPETGKEVLFKDSFFMVGSAALSPDRKYLAVSTMELNHEDQVRLFGAATGKEIRKIGGRSEDASCLAFSPDGKILAVGCMDSKVKLWDAETGKILQTLRLHTGLLNRLTLKLSAESGHPIGAVGSVAFSPDGKLVAGIGMDIMDEKGGGLVTDDVLATIVTPSGRVRFDTNRYSVPPEYNRKHVFLRVNEDEVRVFQGGTEIARHQRSYERRRILVDPQHQAAAFALRRRVRAREIEAQFDALGSEAKSFRLGLLRSPLKPIVHLRRVLGFIRLYGRAEVLAAISQALEYQTFDAAYVMNLIDQARRKRLAPSPIPLAPKRMDLVEEIQLDEPDPAHYDRFLKEEDLP